MVKNDNTAQNRNKRSPSCILYVAKFKILKL